MKLTCPACGAVASVATRNLAIYAQCQTERHKVVAQAHGISESRVKAIVAEVKKTIAKGDSNA